MKKAKRVQTIIFSVSCNYQSPNIKSCYYTDNEIIFFTTRFFGSDSIDGKAIFDRNTFELKSISPYESQYLGFKK